MKKIIRFSLQTQMFFAVLIAVVFGIFISELLSEFPSLSKTSEEVVRPFQTLNEVFLLKIELSNGAPFIVGMVPLDEGRLTTTTQEGDSLIELVSQDGEILYQVGFHSKPMIMDAQISVDICEKIFILPVIDRTAKIVISTPTGDVEYDFP